MKLTKRERNLLIGAVFIIIGVIFTVYVYFPLNKKISTLQIEASDLASQVQQMQLRQVEISKLEKLVAEMNENISENNKDLLTIWDQPEILYYVENIVSNKGKKEAISFLDSDISNGITSGNITLKLTTNYGNLQKVLKAFEKGKYYNNITSMDIIDNKDESNTPLTADIVFKFYSLNSELEYPVEYPFMKGKYKKADLFK